MIKTFEWAWLVIACLSLILGIYKLIFGVKDYQNGYFLLLLSALSIFMWFIKRKSRIMLQNSASGNSPNSGSS